MCSYRILQSLRVCVINYKRQFPLQSFSALHIVRFMVGDKRRSWLSTRLVVLLKSTSLAEANPVVVDFGLCGGLFVTLERWLD